MEEQIMIKSTHTRPLEQSAPETQKAGWRVPGGGGVGGRTECLVGTVLVLQDRSSHQTTKTMTQACAAAAFTTAETRK